MRRPSGYGGDRGGDGGNAYRGRTENQGKNVHPCGSCSSTKHGSGPRPRLNSIGNPQYTYVDIIQDNLDNKRARFFFLFLRHRFTPVHFLRSGHLLWRFQQTLLLRSVPCSVAGGPSHPCAQWRPCHIAEETHGGTTQQSIWLLLQWVHQYLNMYHCSPSLFGTSPQS